MEYQTGDIITAKVHGKPYNHVAIIVVRNAETFIYHNTPANLNEFGGSIIKDTVENFTKTRTINKVVHTALTADFIESQVLEMKTKKFNLIHFNCEHFVYGLTGNAHSPQMQLLYINSSL
ncbi:MAG: hypothetical protein WCJ61_17620 [Paludibacter sp.]